jgi:hypothetical protein
MIGSLPLAVLTRGSAIRGGGIIVFKGVGHGIKINSSIRYLICLCVPDWSDSYRLKCATATTPAPGATSQRAANCKSGNLPTVVRRGERQLKYFDRRNQRDTNNLRRSRSDEKDDSRSLDAG